MIIFISGLEEKMKLFFSKYQDFVTGIKFYDNKKNEFTLKKDGEDNSSEWLPNYIYPSCSG